MIGIYCITNLINNKKYIGQSSNIEQRWQKERTRAFQSKSHEYDKVLSCAFRKYGLQNFRWEVIEECAASELNEREEYWANYFCSYIPYGYNVARCGNQNAISAPGEILLIRQLLKDGHSNTEIANKMNCSWRMISDINCGRAWFCQELDYPIRKHVHGKKCRLNKKYYDLVRKDKVKKQTYLIKKTTKEEFLKLYKFALTNHYGAEWLGEQIGASSTQVRRVLKKCGCPSFITIRHIQLQIEEDKKGNFDLDEKERKSLNNIWAPAHGGMDEIN